jgi:hypothetical protein
MQPTRGQKLNSTGYRRVFRKSLQMNSGRDQDDSSTVSQEGQRFLNREEGTARIDVERLVEMFRRSRRQRREFDETRIGHKNIQRTFLGFRTVTVERPTVLASCSVNASCFFRLKRRLSLLCTPRRRALGFRAHSLE